VKNKTFTMVSLFAGAGGLDIGFEKNGFKTIWANDIDKDACETHRAWSKCEMVCGDISAIDMSIIPDSDIITGGFPCQGFSLAGPRKIDDRRNKLYQYFVKLVEMKKPKAFVAENVKGLMTLGNGTIIQAIVEDFLQKGYKVFPTVVNAADYGVPQDRWRVILLGLRTDLRINSYTFPDPFEKKVYLNEALKGIEQPKMEDVCVAPFSSRYMSRNRKRGWNEVSYTIPAMAKQVPLHPGSPDMFRVGTDLWSFGEGASRRLSWQESAAIQTFPQDICFYGDLVSKYKQIGNAVPVKLAEVVAKEVYAILTNTDSGYSKTGKGSIIKKTGKQVKSGKGFEYATIKSLYNEINKFQEVELVESAALVFARAAYDGLNEIEREKMDKAAAVGVKIIRESEPNIDNTINSSKLLLMMQSDAQGQDGDVRDIIIKRGDWEVGISCKHNHSAVKHSRLSADGDFGDKWFGRPCSEEYFKKIVPIFEKIKKHKESGHTWNDIEGKFIKIYKPVLEAFMNELRLLSTQYKDIPTSLLHYLLGREDFYKLISNDSNRSTKIQTFCMNGTLNRNCNGIKPKRKYKKLNLPTKFTSINFKENTEENPTTILVSCNNGWTISMRLHNAETQIKTLSLKFDVQIAGMPPELTSQTEFWE
jgi:DNA (cytosine-5)-methyltransferase 1